MSQVRTIDPRGMDVMQWTAAVTLDLEQFGSVPPPQAYWLAKRAQSVKTVVPSTYMKGMNAG